MVFSRYRELFPAVQIQVVRSYGARVVEAVMENAARISWLTQLPVEEKRIQVVQHLSRRDPADCSGAASAGGPESGICRTDLVEHFLILPKQGRRGRG